MRRILEKSLNGISLRQQMKFILFIFLLAFTIRALVFQFYLGKNENYWQVDSKTYDQVAKSIAQGKGITLKEKPQFYRLPGYPIFLSAWYKAFGYDKKNVLWIQIFFASIIPILIFFLVLVLSPSAILLAKVTSLYSCIHLGLVLYSGFFMTESLFIFLFLLFLILFLPNLHMFFCYKEFLGDRLSGMSGLICQQSICTGTGFVRFQEKTADKAYKKLNRVKFIQIFLAGIFLGLASLVRPVGHYLLFLSFILLLFSQGRCLLKIKKIFFLFLGWLIPVFPWLLRNYLFLGHIFFHTLPGGHFLHLSAARVAMHPQNCSYWQARDNLEEEVCGLVEKRSEELHRNLNPIEVCKIKENVAIKYFLKYPLLTLKNWVTDILRTSFSLYCAELLFLDSGRIGIDYFGKKRTIWSMFSRYLFPETKNRTLKILIIWEILTYFFVLLGVLFAFVQMIIKLKNGVYLDLCVWLRFLPFILLFLVIGLSGGFNRMRLPAEPLLIILSFSFWVKLFKRES